MDWYEIKKEFNKKFPDYFVSVVPSCISESREYEYIIKAMATALEYETNDKVFVDKEKKRVYYFR